MNSIYLSFFPLVNRNPRIIMRLLFNFILWYSYLLYKFKKSLAMVTNSLILDLDNYMSTLGFSDCSIHRYLKLISKYPAYQKIFINKGLLSAFLKIKDRKIEHHLKHFESYELLNRGYETLDIGQRKVGNSLYIILTPPLHLIYDNSPLTFRARFQSMGSARGHDKELKHAWVTEVYSDKHNLFGGYQRIGMLTKEEVQLFESLEEGDLILFDAEVHSFDEKDPKKIKMLIKPANIRRAYQ